MVRHIILSVLVSALWRPVLGQTGFLVGVPAEVTALTGTQNSNVVACAGNTLFRTDASGILLWAYTYPEVVTIGSVMEVSNGDLMIAVLLHDSDVPDVMHPGIARLTSGGTPIWARSLESDTASLADYDTEIGRAGSGSIVYHDIADRPFITRYSGTGSLSWSRRYAFNNYYVDLVPEGGNYYYAMDALTLHKYRAADGVQIWQRSLSTDAFLRSLTLDGDTIAMSIDLYNNPLGTIGIVLMDTAGALLGSRAWAAGENIDYSRHKVQKVGSRYAMVCQDGASYTWRAYTCSETLDAPADWTGPEGSTVADLSRTPDGNLLVCGSYFDQSSLHGEVVKTPLTPSPDLCAQPANTTSSLVSITTNDLGISDFVDYAPVSEERTLTAVASTWEMTTPCLNTSVLPRTEPPAFSIRPVPASGTVLVSKSGIIGRSLRVLRMDGSLADRWTMAGDQAVIPIDHLAPGVYFVQVITSDGPMTVRLVKQ